MAKFYLELRDSTKMEISSETLMLFSSLQDVVYDNPGGAIIDMSKYSPRHVKLLFSGKSMNTLEFRDLNNLVSVAEELGNTHLTRELILKCLVTE